MDEVARWIRWFSHAFDRPLSYGILASRAQEHLAVSVTVNLHFLWILISPRAGKDPETMATGYRHDREAIINRARCSIVLFLEEQSEITKEGGRWRGEVSRFVVRELRLRGVKWLITDETNEREEIWLNKWETISKSSWDNSICLKFAPKSFYWIIVVLWVYNWKELFEKYHLKTNWLNFSLVCFLNFSRLV